MLAIFPTSRPCKLKLLSFSAQNSQHQTPLLNRLLHKSLSICNGTFREVDRMASKGPSYHDTTAKIQVKLIMWVALNHNRVPSASFIYKRPAISNKMSSCSLKGRDHYVLTDYEWFPGEKLLLETRCIWKPFKNRLCYGIPAFGEINYKIRNKYNISVEKFNVT